MLTIALVRNQAQQRLVLLAKKVREEKAVSGKICQEKLTKLTLLYAIIDALTIQDDEVEFQGLTRMSNAVNNIDGYLNLPFADYDEAFQNTRVDRNIAGGSSEWSEIQNKPAAFNPASHTHPDEQVLVNIKGITETVGGITPGDFNGNLDAFLRKMLIKFQSPVITSFTTNQVTRIVGQSLTAPFNFNWSVSNAANVKDTDNSGNLVLAAFTKNSNDSESGGSTSGLSGAGTFNAYGVTAKTVAIAGTYKMNTIGRLQAQLTVKDKEDNTSAAASLNIYWNVELLYANYDSATISPDALAAFNKASVYSRYGTYSCIGSGYKWIVIPKMLNQTGIGFKDLENGGFDIDMMAPVDVDYTNAYGVTMPCSAYRTVNKLGSTLTATIV